MRPRLFRKGFSKHLRRTLGDEIEDDWADQVVGAYDFDVGGPIDRPTDPVKQGGDAT